MKQSNLFTKTQKQTPKDEESINAILLQRAGFIYKEMAGVYSFLPLGIRVLKNVENIIREEMNRIGSQEILMSVLQPKSLWKKTRRWDQGIGKEIMYKTEEIGLGPTHEEMITDIAAKNIANEEDLPFSCYQIQTKFRKEKRAKSGLLRGREFQMKDMYSFHASVDDFKDYYEKVKKAYLNIFKRCNLQAVITQASGGDFTQEFSHEFQVLSNTGEDIICYCDCGFAQNIEICDKEKCPLCKKPLKKLKAIEGANIFSLGDKYSKALEAFYRTNRGEKKATIMGCYGIGISRLIGTMVEVLHDDFGIVWPKEVAPFDYHLISLNNSEKEAQEIYQKLNNVLYDDRKKTAGEKFADADLIGIPIRIVVSEKTLKTNSVEIKKRHEKKTVLIKIKELHKCLTKY